MKKIKFFSKIYFKKFIREIQKNDLVAAANNLTYKIFFSMFPFIIFLISVVGFLPLDESYLIEQLYSILPDTIQPMIQTFVEEVIGARSRNILSFSLILSIWSASWGFGTLMKSVNMAYGQTDTRHIIKKILINMASVIALAIVIILSFVMLIFGDNILKFLQTYIEINETFMALSGLFRYVASVSIMFLAILSINKISVSEKVSWKSLIPGSLVTVVGWIIASELFNVYIKNFSRYSNVYGSLAAIIIFMLWLNILCLVLLFGSVINAVNSKISN